MKKLLHGSLITLGLTLPLSCSVCPIGPSKSHADSSLYFNDQGKLGDTAVNLVKSGVLTPDIESSILLTW